MRRILVLVGAILPLELASGQVGGVTRDSAGIHVVTHAASAASPVYELRPTRVGIGTEAGAELTRVLSALRMPNGSIVVLDIGLRQLLRFTPSGALDRIIGRDGAGPGEFTGPVWMGRYGRDSIAAYDNRQVRYSVYGDSGFVRQGVLEKSDHMYTMEMIAAGMLSNGTPVITKGSTLQLAAEGPARIERQPNPVVSYGKNGKPGRLIGSYPGSELEVSKIEEGPLTGGFVNGFRLFGVTSALAVVGNHLIVADTREFGFDVVDTLGKVIRRVRRVGGPQPVLTTHKAAYVAERVSAAREARREALRKDLESQAHAPVFPQIEDRVIVDAEQRIWLGEYKRPGDREQAWWLFNLNGTLLGRVVVPSTLRVTDAGANYLLGVWTDESGVQTVRLYDLVRRQ